MSEDVLEKLTKDCQQELSRLGEVMWSNFKYACEQCIKLAPDQLSKEQRAIVWAKVTEAWIGGAVLPVVTYGNSTRELEDDFVQEVRRKFAWIREHEKDLQLNRLDRIAEERQKKTGIILAPGSDALN